MKLNPELTISLLALLTSFISILLAFLTYVFTIRHNKLSVKPIPEITLSKENGVAITLKNLGTGPLVCKALMTYTDGKEIYHLKNLIPEPPEHLEGKLYTDRWNFALLPGEEKIILKVEHKESLTITSKYWENLYIALSKATISLSYTSIYEEEFPDYAKSLKWLSSTI